MPARRKEGPLYRYDGNANGKGSFGSRTKIAKSRQGYKGAF
ncbi:MULTISPECIES: hypothetical protein [unclassified Streptomyces]|nr:hypothetical protein [Streptomyces sp. CB01580]